MLYLPLLSTSGEWFPERRGLVTGLVTAGGALGQGLLPFLDTDATNLRVSPEIILHAVVNGREQSILSDAIQ